ncbi:RluA family pseudouridine synthase [Varibaculum cambriense]|uniref:RluA family pseudouridine synthase n=1 Tax=Varibaculum cambriense TaxID=184870 RepID=UPI00290E42F9|nr:RluA family pseudouridine synthase [Varibaculum cambriense]MDU3273739.1 RluA family pseudouridine synthase [Varibaculum cambriense]
MRERVRLLLPESAQGKRLDQVLAAELGISRSLVAKLIKQNEVKVNGVVSRKSAEVARGDQVEVLLPDASPKTLETPAPLPILYQDADIVVVNKPVGMAAHTAPGWEGPTVVGALLAAGAEIVTSGPAERKGIVHRLDVGTSGAMVVAKSELAYGRLQDDFRERRVQKIYHALVQGYLDAPAGTIDAPIGRHPSRDFKMAVVTGGRPAITHYRTVECLPGASLLEVQLETGRTHQIRVHMEAIGHGIVGDPIYGANPRLAQELGLTRQWLHAVTLGFTHPVTGEQMSFGAPLTADLEDVLTRLHREF